jgi:hypothetical protein
MDLSAGVQPANSGILDSVYSMSNSGIRIVTGKMYFAEASFCLHSSFPFDTLGHHRITVVDLACWESLMMGISGNLECPCDGHFRPLTSLRIAKKEHHSKAANERSIDRPDESASRNTVANTGESKNFQEV